MRKYSIYLLLFVIASCMSKPENKPAPVVLKKSGLDLLKENIHGVIDSIHASIGIGIVGPNGDTLSINGNTHFPMMSVAKFPQALALMHLVEEGKMLPTEKLHITKHDLEQRTFSSLRKDHPQESFDLTIEEAFQYSIGQSDNITSNVIFDRTGGPAAVETFVRQSGIVDMGIATDYWHLSEDIYRNWSTPNAMAKLLELFYTGKLLKSENQALIWNAMVNAVSGPNRIKGLLPEGTVVGHKTGTGDTDKNTQMIYAFNDVGVIVLPNGQHFTIAIFVKDAFEKEEKVAEIQAKISKTVWDYYNNAQ